MNISLIVPAYNEEENIGKVIGKVPSSVDEIIIVDDGSIDGTSEIASKHPVKLFRHDNNLGKGEALKSGARLAKGNVLAFMDGDGQHDPLELDHLIKPILQGESDMVIGYRDLKGAPLIRKFSNFMARTSVKLFTKQDVKDPLCGFRAVRKDSFNKLEIKRKGYEVEFDMIFEALKNNLKISNVMVSVDYRSGKSSIKLVDNIKIILFVLRNLFNKLG